jgi:hypothetical protein
MVRAFRSVRTGRGGGGVRVDDDDDGVERVADATTADAITNWSAVK